MTGQSPTSLRPDLLATLERAPGLQGLGDSLLESFAVLMDVLMEFNMQHNLTAYRSPDEIAVHHFADSMAPVASPEIAAWLGSARKGVDIGSGAGFPLLPLALRFSDCQWTAVEAVAKKCRFIAAAATRLGISNVRALHVRAEDLARTDERESFDIATARAVGPSASLCEVGLPLLRQGGRLLLYKTVNAAAEIEACKPAIRQLGGELADIHHYRFPADEHERMIVDIRKTTTTPDRYPRNRGIPFKRPLR